MRTCARVVGGATLALALAPAPAPTGAGVGVNHVIWSNGLLDPWHGGGFLKPGDPRSGNHWVLMPNGP